MDAESFGNRLPKQQTGTAGWQEASSCRTDTAGRTAVRPYGLLAAGMRELTGQLRVDRATR